jgi:hypothetical protein
MHDFLLSSILCEDPEPPPINVIYGFEIKIGNKVVMGVPAIKTG